MQRSSVLIDPYSKRLDGHFTWTDAHFGYRTGHKLEDLSFDRRDNSRGMYKTVVDVAHTWARENRPAVAWEDTIIYEAHVKGLTQQREDIPAELRGTFRGLAEPGMIEHLRKIGATAIELLPIHAFVDGTAASRSTRNPCMGGCCGRTRRFKLRCCRYRVRDRP
jgi:isoamylase